MNQPITIDLSAEAALVAGAHKELAYLKRFDQPKLNEVQARAEKVFEMWQNMVGLGEEGWVRCWILLGMSLTDLSCESASHLVSSSFSLTLINRFISVYFAPRHRELNNGLKVEGEWILYGSLTCKMDAQGFITGFMRCDFALVYNSGIIYFEVAWSFRLLWRPKLL